CDIQRPRGRFGRRRIVQVGAGVDQVAGDGAVELAGVEVRIAEGGGEPPGERSLARGGGAVDRDHRHGQAAAVASAAMAAPSAAVPSANPGKLVSIGEASSTATGSAVTSPSTRKLIAMR